MAEKVIFQSDMERKVEENRLKRQYDLNALKDSVHKKEVKTLKRQAKEQKELLEKRLDKKEAFNAKLTDMQRHKKNAERDRELTLLEKHE